MELSPFVKFKNLTREIGNGFRDDLKVAKDEQIIAEKELVKHLNVVSKKVRKKIEIDGKVIGEIIDVDTVSDVEPLYELIKKNEEVDRNRAGVAKVQSLINAFDNEKCICYVKDIYMLLSALISFVPSKEMTVEEASQVLGAAIYFNSKKGRKNKDDINVLFYRELEKYFNQDGTFRFSEDLEGLYNNLKALCSNYKGFSEFEKTYEGYKSRDLVLDISNLYLDFYRDYPTYIEKRKDTLSLPTYTYSEVIRRYYKDGELISIPEDIDAFLEELKKSYVSSQEINYIMSLINLAKSSALAEVLNEFYSESEAELVRNAEVTFEKMKPYEENYYEIKEILIELQTLRGLYLDSISTEDKAFITEEKDAYITRLRELTIFEEEQELINIAFLSDGNGNSYFHKDLETIDKGLRKRVPSLLAKINNDGKRYFRKVFPTEEIDFEIYEVYNPDLHIIFTEIPGNVFMIIGIATTGNGYREITNRLVNKENQRNILEIIEAIKEEDVKKKYLTEQNALIPQVSEKRVRKQIDN